MAGRPFIVSDLVTEIRRRAGMERTQFVTDLEIVNYIDKSYCYLYDTLVATYENYFVTPVDDGYTIAGTNSVGNFPTDLYKLLGVDIKGGSGSDDWVTLRRYEFTERNNYRSGFFTSMPMGTTANLRWSLQGDDLKIIPAPTATYKLKYWYIPLPPVVNSLSQSLNGWAGWEEFVINDCAMKCRVKMQLECSEIILLKSEAMKRIIDMAQDRTPNEPAKVSDTSVNYSQLPWGGILY